MTFVQFLIENDEWDIARSEAENRMRYIRRQESSLKHHRLALVDEITAKFPEYGDLYDYGQWRVKELLTRTWPEGYKRILTKLAEIDVRSDKLSKLAINAKLNMKYFIHDPELALRHAEFVRHGQFPEGEDAIASTAQTAFDYATKVLKQRFPKGEPAIATNNDLKQQYIAKFGGCRSGYRGEI